MAATDLALARLEHKLDIIIQALQVQGIVLPSPLPALAEKGLDLCPVCSCPQSYKIDVPSESVLLTCGCTLPVRVIPGISTVGVPPPNPPAKRDDDDRSSEASEPEAVRGSGGAPTGGGVPGGRAPSPGPGDRN